MMFTRLEIKKVDKENGLTEEYSFYYDEYVLWLDTYRLTKKEGKKKIQLKYYNRLSERESTITENEVPFTDEIKAKAIAEVVKRTVVKKWSERQW